MKAAAVAPLRPATASRGKDLRCFTIKSGDRMFGLPVEAIQTVFEITSVTPVPLAPKAILGLVNLRGKIATAVSLQQRLTDGEAPDPSRLAVGLEFKGEDFALVVDEVGDVVALHEDWQLEPPHLGAERAKVAAVYRLDDTILPILSLDWVLAFEDRHP